MLSLNPDGDWNAAKVDGTTPERLTKSRNPPRHHDWRNASSAPPGNYRLPARHHRHRTTSQTMLRPLAEATPAGDGREPGVDVYVVKALIVPLVLRRRHAQGVRTENSAAAHTAHPSHPLRPAASRFAHQPNDPLHPAGKSRPDGPCCDGPVWLRRHHPPADVRYPAIGQAADPGHQDCAAHVVDVNP